MSITVKEVGQEAESERTTSERTAYREFVVRDSVASVAVVSLIDAETAVVAAIGDIGDAHPDDSSRKIKSIKSLYREKQVRNVVTVQVDYSTITNSYNANPLLDPDKWEYQPDKSEEEYYLDTADNKCLLTNGKPLHPLPKRRKYLYTLQIERNVSASYSPANLTAINGKSNSDSITYEGITIGIGEGLAEAKLSKQQERNGYTYRVLTISIVHNPEKHHDKFESRDKEELASGALKPIKDGNGKQVSFAYPLTSTGAAASSPTTDPYLIELVPYEEAALSGYVDRT